MTGKRQGKPSVTTTESRHLHQDVDSQATGRTTVKLTRRFADLGQPSDS
ncbi:hypothetical protein M2150_002709 [Lachnospiraceae bacterium PM6-15]